MRRHANHKPVPVHERNKVAKTRAFALHKVNPAGSKFMLRAYKAKHGAHADNVETARKWYASYLKDMDAKVRKADEAKIIARIKRRFPWLAHRLPEAA